MIQLLSRHRSCDPVRRVTRRDTRPKGRCAVTIAEYMNPHRFPLTTQKGLPPEWQLMLDARNLDWLNAAESAGGLTPKQERRLKELRDKAAAHLPLMAEVN